MAVGTWAIYDKFKEFQGDNTIDMDAAAQFNLHLFTTAASANVNTQSLSTLGSLGNEVLSANGYTLSGKALAQTWGVGASSGETRFDATTVTWSAAGGNISNVRYAVVVANTGTSAKDTANKLVCFVSLSTVQFEVNSGAALSVTPAATGIFELN